MIQNPTSGTTAVISDHRKHQPNKTPPNNLSFSDVTASPSNYLNSLACVLHGRNHVSIVATKTILQVLVNSSRNWNQLMFRYENSIHHQYLHPQSTSPKYLPNLNSYHLIITVCFSSSLFSFSRQWGKHLYCCNKTPARLGC